MINKLVYELFNISYKSYNLDNFHNNTMLIVGYSGSGKTTLAKELSKKYNCKLDSTDTVMAEAFPNGKLDKNIEQLAMKELRKVILQKQKKIILEGIHIVNVYDKYPDIRTYMLNLPIIIMSSNALSSSFNAMKRDRLKYGILDPLITNFQHTRKLFNIFRSDLDNMRI